MAGFKVIGVRPDGGINVYHGFSSEAEAAGFGQLKINQGEISSYHVTVENTGHEDNLPKNQE